MYIYIYTYWWVTLGSVMLSKTTQVMLNVIIVFHGLVLVHPARWVV